jgi:hypothetical protein
MFNFIGKWFAGKESRGKEDEGRKKFLEAVNLMLDGEASPEQQKFVMDKIRCCQFSNSKYELEKCLREKLKSLYCCKEMPDNLDKRIMEKITTHNQL